MSTAALVPVRAGRPTIVVVDGATVYVSVMDAAHASEKARFKQEIARADSRGLPAAIAAYATWEEQELARYARLGLLVPSSVTARPLLGVTNRPAMNPKSSQCQRGHAWTPDNTIIQGGARTCRTCRRASRRRRAKKRNPS